MRKAVLISSWFIATPLTIASLLLPLHFVNQHKFLFPKKQTISKISTSYEMFSALPRNTGPISWEVKNGDARPIILWSFLSQNHSPLTPYASKIVTISDRYGLDFRLITAIAMQESNLGKKAPEGIFNAWGFGNGTTKFSSWEEAIEKVAKTLKEEYIDQGLETPFQIMPKYAPPSVEKGGPWARGVQSFIDQMQ